MTDENKQNEENKQPVADGAKVSDDQLTKVMERMAGIETKFNQMIDVTSELLSSSNNQPAPVKEEPKENRNLNSDEFKEKFDNDPQGTLQAMMNVTADEKIANSKDADSKQSLAERYDANAETKFPDLKDPSSKFYKATQEIIAKKKQLDPTYNKRADAVWSSAHEAHVALGSSNTHIPGDEATRQNVINNSYVGSNSSGIPIANSSIPTEPTKRRESVARSLGVSMDIYNKN